MISAVTIVAGLSLAAWIYLVLFRGGSWQADIAVLWTDRSGERREKKAMEIDLPPA